MSVKAMEMGWELEASKAIQGQKESRKRVSSLASCLDQQEKTWPTLGLRKKERRWTKKRVQSELWNSRVGPRVGVSRSSPHASMTLVNMLSERGVRRAWAKCSVPGSSFTASRTNIVSPSWWCCCWCCCCCLIAFCSVIVISSPTSSSPHTQKRKLRSLTLTPPSQPTHSPSHFVLPEARLIRSTTERKSRPKPYSFLVKNVAVVKATTTS